jgi:hypothetical protein
MLCRNLREGAQYSMPAADSWINLAVKREEGDEEEVIKISC